MNLYLILGLCLFTVLVESRKECVPKHGKDTTYCVCNSTYCDDLDSVVKQPKGVALIYETNKQGERMKESKLEFTKTANITQDTFVFRLERNHKYQKITGFGAAFTDSAGINLKALPEAMAHNVIKDYFGDNGIQSTMGRVPIGGCDFSPRGYTYDDNPDDFDLKQWKLQKEDIEYKIPYIKQAKNLSSHGVRLFGSPWSPPAWMKTGNPPSLKGGALIGNPGEKYYKTWANYFVKFLDAYKENGCEMWGITVENEPAYAYPEVYGWNGLSITPAQERDFVKLDLGPALEKAGYGPDKLNVMVYDHGPGGGAKLFDGAHTCFNDSQAKKYLRGTAFHCYGDGPNTWPALEILHEVYPEMFILMTECCQEFTALVPNYIQKPGNWNNAMTYARDIIGDLLHWSQGWVEWNLVLDMFGLPHWSGMMGEAPIMVNTTSHEYYKDAKFYVMGQFYKFLVPDSQRIKLSGNQTNNDIDGVSFVRPDNATVLVIRNSNHKDIPIVIDDWTQSGKLTTKIGADSVQTYIFWP